MSSLRATLMALQIQRQRATVTVGEGLEVGNEGSERIVDFVHPQDLVIVNT